MWTTLLLLAIAFNFEPTRVSVVALMISGRRPVQQTLTLLSCGFGLAAAVGLLVLFVFDIRSFAPDHFNSSTIQIGIGTILLIGSAVIATNLVAKLRKRKKPDAIVDTRGVERLSTRVHDLLHSKSWLSGAAGVVLALPSGEYLALLALIATSNVTEATKVTALFVFLFIANAISAIPLMSYLISPDKTRNAVQRFNKWLLARSRRQVSSVLAAAGLILILTGIG